MSPAREYDEKKMKSPGWASDNIPCRICRLPQHPEVTLRLVARGGKVGCHGHMCWCTEVGKKRRSARQQETGGKRDGCKGSVYLWSRCGAAIKNLS
jgi:hypothetical protein